MNTYFIGNTHFDPVWLWRWDEAMAAIRATFRSALARMDEYPDYIYSFSCPPVFEWIKNTDPDMFSEIQRRVKEGRWELCEGWWLQPDCNTPSGEGLARQGLYGQRYLESNFGTRSHTLFNIDSFGHCATLPQIITKSGITDYLFSRGDFPSEGVPPKSLFKWHSPDGSTVTAYKVGANYMIDSAAEAAAAKGDMAVYGVSDHGGAPTKKMIEDIYALKDIGAVFGTVQGFFDSHREDELPEKSGELFVGFYGPYSNSNISDVKHLNRVAEYAALNAEKASVIAVLACGEAYQGDKIEDVWRDIMFNTFHDILGGTCTKEAYFDVRNQHGRAIFNANELLYTKLQSVTKHIDIKPAVKADGTVYYYKNPAGEDGTPWNVVVWNLNAFESHTAVEIEMQWVWEFDWYRDEILVLDSDGNVIPSQNIREYSVIPGFRTRVAFVCDLPALGYRTFSLVQSKKAIDIIADRERDPYTLETDRYIVKINGETGGFSLFDKKANKTLLKDAFVPKVYSDTGDTWAFNAARFGEQLNAFKLESCEVIEDGGLRTTIKTRSIFNHSRIDQYYTVYHNEAFVDLRYKIMWDEPHTALKLAFVCDEAESVRAEIPYGSITRPFDGLEYPVGQWLTVGDTTIINDSIFAYNTEKDKNEVGLTVLRTPIYGDLRIGELDKRWDLDYLDLGAKEGRLRVYPFCENSVHAAAEFVNPPLTVLEACHDGELSPNGSYIKVKSDNATISTVKRAEDGDDIIVRLAEYNGKTDDVTIKLAGVEYKTQCSPYEIKTLGFGKDGVRELDILEEENK